MERAMNALTMTDGQIDTAVNQLRDAMRKHRDEIPRDAAQQALGVDNLGMQMFAVFRGIAETLSEMFSRRVRVNRNLTPDQVIDNTRRVRGYVEDVVLATMPGVGSGPEKDVVWFFELDYDPTPAELSREYEFRELVPDAAALAQAVADDPGLADERPVACQWDLNNGAASCAIFDRWHGKRLVGVDRSGSRWDRRFLFAGVRK